MKHNLVAIAAILSVASLACAPRAQANHGLRIDEENGAGCMSTYTTDSSNAAALAFSPGGTYATITSCTPIGTSTADLFPDGNLNDAATVNPSYTATGGRMFQYFTGAVVAGTVPEAQVALWNLATGPFGASETEVELNGWCASGGNASFSFDGNTYSGGCGGTPTDLLFSSAGALLGYVSDSSSGASIITVSSLTGWKENGGAIGGGTVSAPEVDPTHLASGLTLLLGGLAVIRGGRRTQTRVR